MLIGAICGAPAVTVQPNVCDALAPRASVTVTVGEKLPAVLKVPLIRPVFGFTVRLFGKPVAAKLSLSASGSLVTSCKLGELPTGELCDSGAVSIGGRLIKGKPATSTSARLRKLVPANCTRT